MKKMGKQLQPIERVYSGTDESFTNLIHTIVNNKIEELVNNHDKVNTATSQNIRKGNDLL